MFTQRETSHSPRIPNLGTFKLPPELRLKVFKYLFNIAVIPHGKNQGRSGLGVLLVCRTFYYEAKDLWLPRISFAFATPWDFMDFVMTTEAAKLRLVRHASITTHPPWEVEPKIPGCCDARDKIDFKQALHLAPFEALALDTLTVYDDDACRSSAWSNRFLAINGRDEDERWWNIIVYVRVIALVSSKGWKELRIICEQDDLLAIHKDPGYEYVQSGPCPYYRARAKTNKGTIDTHFEDFKYFFRGNIPGTELAVCGAASGIIQETFYHQWIPPNAAILELQGSHLDSIVGSEDFHACKMANKVIVIAKKAQNDESLPPSKERWPECLRCILWGFGHGGFRKMRSFISRSREQ